MNILEKYETHNSYDINKLRLIPQNALIHKVFPEECKHNAMWDFYVSKNGRVFFSLCAELETSLYVRLYEYLEKTDEFKLCFNLEDIIIQQDRAIRASKIHTSITEINDGRLIMTTHTTAQSPSHPYWMPEAYYYHLWEGFQGSNIIIYDPDRGILENRGVPIPHEAIYGTCYDSTKNCLYFTGYIRGHLYRFDLDTNRVTDYGQVTEFGSFRLAKGPDGNIYNASRSGNFNRVNVKTQQVEELGIDFPDNYDEWSLSHRRLDYTVNCYDGKMYMGAIFCKTLLCYDPSSNKLSEVGEFVPEGLEIPNTAVIMGMCFDEGYCLWYGVLLFDAMLQSRGLRLCKWDFLKGDKPVDYGLIGSVKRSVLIAPEMHYFKGKIYLADSNHGNDPPGVMVIDLDKIKNNFGNSDVCPVTMDAFNYCFVRNPESIYKFIDMDKGLKCVSDFLQSIENYNNFMGFNSCNFETGNVEVYRIWKKQKPEESAVKYLRFQVDGSLYCECGNDQNKKSFIIASQEISDFKTINEFSEDSSIYKKEQIEKVKLPFVSGRQYKAKASASAKWKEDKIIIGTLDGMIAIVDGENVFSLGLCAVNGPVRQIVVDETNEVAYGIAGDESDLGMVFSFDEKNGLKWLGRVFFNKFKEPGIAASCELSAIAISKDGKRLAIGSRDRMGCVYVYTL